ncbi:MAG: Uma2 family endonuclease [Planctomycetia bacterium]|nr:Uma2 family endonuclease [Planctomycetia bacterium]
MSTSAIGLPVPAPLPERVYTPEDLLTMPDGFRFELIEGKLVERNMGAVASQVAMKLMTRVGTYVEAQKLGRTFGSDCGYQCFPNQPKQVRFADGSFVAKGRLPEERVPDGHMRIAPDLAVEVISPNDIADEVEAKREEWLEAGVKLLWLIYPPIRSVRVYHVGGQCPTLGPNDELSGEDVLPGFTCKVAELFVDG